ncbi:MAG: apolipoprotein N-acyltransferase [Polyangiaceae bacterium]|jgi:apolipoprotein N-acyltransferase
MATTSNQPAGEPTNNGGARLMGWVLPRAGALPLSPPLAFGGAVLSGILYWLAFPGVDAWPLAFVAWVPLIVAMHRQPTSRALQIGWVAGITMNVGGFAWLQPFLRTFSGFPLPVCLLFSLIICAYQGGRIALLGWLYGRGTARGRPWPATFALAFVASELLFPLLFPWYYAATVHSVPALVQLADIGGPILVGLSLVGPNLAIAEIALAFFERRPLKRGPVWAGASALAITGVYGAARIRSIDASARAAPASTVGIVQADMGLIEKRSEFGEGLRRHLQLSQELKARQVDFLVWSETSAMRAVRDESFRVELHGLAQRIGLPTLFGAVIVKVVPDARTYVLFNSAIAADASGTIGSRYDKEYLLTFGEYLPFGDTFPILYKWSPNSGHFTPGTSLDPLVLDVRGTPRRISALICYEDILPRFTNDAVRQGKPELLVNMTNDAWFGETAEPWEHLALSQFRAIEHRRYLVRGTNSGVSAVVDPVGRVVLHGRTFRQEALSSTIHWMQSQTVYEVLGDWPWLLASAVAGMLAFRRRSAPKASLPS